MILPWQLPSWLETGLVVALGTGVVVGGAAVCVRLARAVVWQRAFWQVSILGIFTLLAAEATGVATGIVQCWRSSGIAATRGSPLAVREAPLCVGRCRPIPSPTACGATDPLDATMAVRGSPDPALDATDRSPGTGTQPGGAVGDARRRGWETCAKPHDRDTRAAPV